MKLLLNSWAQWTNDKLGKAFLDLLTKPIKENKLFILSMDTTSASHNEHLVGVGIKWYIDIGFQENNIKIYSARAKSQFESMIIQFSSFYVGVLFTIQIIFHYLYFEPKSYPVS